MSETKVCPAHPGHEPSNKAYHCPWCEIDRLRAKLSEGDRLYLQACRANTELTAELAAGWRKQGAAHPDTVARLARVFVAEGPSVPWEQLTEHDQRLVILGVRAVLAEAGLLAGQGAADDDTTRLRAEVERLTAERDALERKVTDRDAVIAGQQEAGAALIRERDDLKARVDEARGIAEEMRSQLVNGPELNDVLRILAALTQVSQPQPEPEPQPGDRVRVTIHRPFGTDRVAPDGSYKHREYVEGGIATVEVVEPAEVSQPQEGQS